MKHCKPKASPGRLTPSGLVRTARHGTTLVEFVLACALLAVLLVVLFQLAYAFSVYNLLQNAVRSGARWAALQAYESASSTPTPAYVTAVRNVVVYGSPLGGTRPVVGGLKPEHVTVSMTMKDGVPYQVEVSIAGYEINTGMRAFRLTDRPRAVFPYAGRYAPPL